MRVLLFFRSFGNKKNIGIGWKKSLKRLEEDEVKKKKKK
jgi:hypothetical protein